MFVSFGTSDQNCSGSSISGGAKDDDDVAVIITGISGVPQQHLLTLTLS